ncbi:carbohydrate ABC transporter permease [Alteribacillus sp. HJP-4]|uniref:carbohydrate ABC transporter permease n=1 Tax=Alteribacillus sp. HJP-4 TaxID=2775394 RepID=UPI0035CCE5AC
MKTSQLRRELHWSRLLLHLIIIIGAIVMAAPFIWMVTSSFKTLDQMFAVPPEFIPRPIVWTNFIESLQALPFGRAYFNSFYITTIIVLAQMITASMAAYAFAKIKFPGNNVLFVFFLATMMIPIQVTIIPLYLIMSSLGLLDNHLSIILPNALFNALGVFLLRQFMMTIPDSMEEAAIVDGANPLQIYWKIMLPLVRPPLAAFGIFAFVSMWNNFLQPLVFLYSTELATVPLMLQFFSSQYATNWPQMMAGATISVLPVLIVYIIAQKQIIEGIALTGTKG